MTNATSETPIDERLAHTWLGKRIEVITAILLGVVSCVTAYAGFQAALYDSNMASAYSQAQVLSTQAESLYLEANQSYTQDAQLWNTLNELSIDMESGDADLASRASIKYSVLYSDAVSAELDGAIQRSLAAADANGGEYVDPLSDEEYLTALFGASGEVSDQSAAKTEDGNLSNSYGDKLTLYTVLMTISLFLLGVAAVVTRQLIKFMLIGFSVVVFLTALVLTLMVPFVALG
jgi:Tfp pilus assembly protein PilV